MEIPDRHRVRSTRGLGHEPSAGPLRSSASRPPRLIPRPAHRMSPADHSAADVEGGRRDAHRSRAGTPAGTHRRAEDRVGREEHVALARGANPAAEQPHERVPRRDARRPRTGMTRPAGPVDLTRGDPCKADPWTLRAPDRPVPIPDADRRAGEREAGGDEWGQKEHQRQTCSSRLRKTSVREELPTFRPPADPPVIAHAWDGGPEPRERPAPPQDTSGSHRKFYWPLSG